MSASQIIVVGGGAAGFFAAITAAEMGAKVRVLEKSGRFLEKVRISGGGRCNVTHACPDIRVMAGNYPRGSRAVLGPFHQFSMKDTVEWFGRRGVRLKTEKDGRMFPESNTSETIVACLLGSARDAGVELFANTEVASLEAVHGGGYRLGISGLKGETVELEANRVLLATGGCRSASQGLLAAKLGHALIPPVPSLFTFIIESGWLRSLSGISLEDVEVVAGDLGLRQRGPILITHWGLSGPVVLKMSAWGARDLHAANYCFTVRVNWIPGKALDDILGEIQHRRQSAGNKLVSQIPIAPVPLRLWENLVMAGGLNRDVRWSGITRNQIHALGLQLTRSEFPVAGKSLNKDEFVTCGGIKLGEVNLQTMESKVSPGLFFAGELLDIDGITGGFNFQAAWTTGYIAGRAMASS